MTTPPRTPPVERDGPVPTPAGKAPSRHRFRWKLLLAGLVLIPLALFGGYVWLTLRFAYSRGERAGFVQKFSLKGWVCKTWEGELAMVNLPGTTHEIFAFTVRDPRVADRINQSMGQRVALSYEQHRGVPTTCFGETEYFVTEARAIQP